MSVDPVGLDFDIESKTLDKVAKTCTIVTGVYWNGVKTDTLTLILDASRSSKSTPDFGYTLNVAKGP